MPEMGASGSVGAPLEESGALPGNGCLPTAWVPSIYFRFSLEQTSLRAGEGFCILRLEAVRSLPRCQLPNAKSTRL